MVNDENPKIQKPEEDTISPSQLRFELLRISNGLTGSQNLGAADKATNTLESELRHQLAWERALEVVGGEAYRHAKAAVKKLDNLDLKAEDALLKFDSNRGGWAPFDALKRRHLLKEHQTIRTQYNDAVARLNSKTQYLLLEPKRAELVREVQRIIRAEALEMVRSLAQVHQRKEAVRSIFNSTKTRSNALEFSGRGQRRKAKGL